MCKAMEVDTLSEEYGPVENERPANIIEQELMVADAEYDRLFERVTQLEEENKRITSILEKAIDILAMRFNNVRN